MYICLAMIRMRSAMPGTGMLLKKVEPFMQRNSLGGEFINAREDVSLERPQDVVMTFLVLHAIGLMPLAEE